jgi:hypothetical protein
MLPTSVGWWSPIATITKASTRAFRGRTSDRKQKESEQQASADFMPGPSTLVEAELHYPPWPECSTVSSVPHCPYEAPANEPLFANLSMCNVHMQIRAERLLWRENRQSRCA